MLECPDCGFECALGGGEIFCPCCQETFKYCQKCGEVLKKHHKFCPVCGRPREEAVKKDVSEVGVREGLGFEPCTEQLKAEVEQSQINAIVYGAVCGDEGKRKRDLLTRRIIKRARDAVLVHGAGGNYTKNLEGYSELKCVHCGRPFENHDFPCPGCGQDPRR